LRKRKEEKEKEKEKEMGESAQKELEGLMAHTVPKIEKVRVAFGALDNYFVKVESMFLSSFTHFFLFTISPVVYLTSSSPVIHVHSYSFHISFALLSFFTYL
jgi:hypothetical protein